MEPRVYTCNHRVGAVPDACRVGHTSGNVAVIELRAHQQYDPGDIVTHKFPRGLGLVRCPALKANVITWRRNQKGAPGLVG